MTKCRLWYDTQCFKSFVMLGLGKCWVLGVDVGFRFAQRKPTLNVSLRSIPIYNIMVQKFFNKINNVGWAEVRHPTL